MFDSLSLHKQLEQPSQNGFPRVDNEEQLVECLYHFPAAVLET